MAIEETAVSKKSLWAGRIMSGFATLFLLMDGIMKLVKPPVVVESMVKLGYPDSTTLPIGIVVLVATIFYIIPRTNILGAILLTGFLGGAVATNLRVGAPLFSNILFPVYTGVLVWGGLYLRDTRLRALFPLRSS